MAIVTDSATALAIIESWDWNDVWNFHAECEMPLMLQLSEVINQLAMEGHYDSAGATLSLLAEGKLIATGSFRWKAFRNGHYQREGTGRIPAHRWSVLQDARAACDDPFFPNETTLRLLDGNWGERKEELFVWSWDKDWFSTAQTAKGDWLDEGYFEETYTVRDIELRPASPVSMAAEPTTSEQALIEHNRGGAPAKYDWERAVAAIVFQRADEGSWQPASQADVKRRLADWFGERGEHPSDSLLKERAKWLFEEFRRRAGEADNLAA